jgi:hypothetical protein
MEAFECRSEQRCTVQLSVVSNRGLIHKLSRQNGGGARAAQAVRGVSQGLNEAGAGNYTSASLMRIVGRTQRGLICLLSVVLDTASLKRGGWSC